MCNVNDRERKEREISWHRVKGESYKHLRILEINRFIEEEMKLKVSKEYFRGSKKLLNSKSNGCNLVQVVNTWAASPLRYLVVFVSCRKSEFQTIDGKIRKLVTIYGGLHPKSAVDR